MTHYVLIQGEVLAADIYAPENPLADVVLVHGFTGSKEDFNELGPLLADRGFRVLTFDNRGQHESAHSIREGAYEADSLARDVFEISQHFGLKKPHLLGHSFGGLISQRTVVDFPDAWSSLTIFCSGPEWIPNKSELPMLIELLQTTSMEDFWYQFREETDKLLPRYELYKKRWKASDPRSTTTMALHLLNAQTLIPEIAKLNLPIHVVYGENDDAWPLEMQDQMAKDLSAKLTVIKDAGHCPNEDQPEETARVLADFWATLKTS